MTQRELAKLVSAGTVSNLISGSTRGGEDASSKVLDAIRALKYQPKLIARSLRTNRTHTLGIVVPDLTIPFFAKIVRGTESAARERGYFVIVLDSERSHDTEIDMMDLLRQRVDGILLVTTAGYNWSAENAAAIASVVQPTYEIGHRAVEVLFDRIVHRASWRHQRIVGAPASDAPRPAFVVHADKRERFWVSQDERHTVRPRLRHQIGP